MYAHKAPKSKIFMFVFVLENKLKLHTIIAKIDSKVNPQRPDKGK
jgi:hypothetical protein